MRLGLFMMPLHPSYRAIADCYDRDIDQLVLADKLGFDEAWLGEHFTEKWENPFEGRIHPANALAKLLVDLERVVILLDLEVDPQHPADRQIRRCLTVRHAVAFEPPHALALQGLAKLVQEA